MSSYSVNECEGQVSIVVVVKGSLKREIALHLSTNNLTANGKQMVSCIHNIIMIFSFNS